MENQDQESAGNEITDIYGISVNTEGTEGEDKPSAWRGPKDSEEIEPFNHTDHKEQCLYWGFKYTPNIDHDNIEYSTDDEYIKNKIRLHRALCGALEEEGQLEIESNNEEGNSINHEIHEGVSQFISNNYGIIVNPECNDIVELINEEDTHIDRLSCNLKQVINEKHLDVSSETIKETVKTFCLSCYSSKKLDIDESTNLILDDDEREEKIENKYSSENSQNSSEISHYFEDDVFEYYQKKAPVYIPKFSNDKEMGFEEGSFIFAAEGRNPLVGIGIVV